MKEYIVKILAILFSQVNNNAKTQNTKCWALVGMSQRGVAPKAGTSCQGYTFKGRKECERLKVEKKDIDKAASLDRAMRSAQGTLDCITRLEKSGK